ncbi:MAG: hypothetical protein LUE64_03870, partial [Candidatus Gastranaerophilales bacterium]|nr:hypothetical protein [Candidatus Gastranaerophilales bacterium]
MQYEKILKSSGKFRVNLGLERIKKILELFDNPQDSIKCIHVAGTNGKGSVCAIIEKILLQDKSLKVGKYTSPHLFDYCERISVNGKNISKKTLNEYILKIIKKDEENKIGLTEFEILTAACFLHFRNENVQIAIIETGLGGRFDATNVIKNPLVSIITSISFDHRERLGATIEKIAFEKAGIMKKNSPVVFLEENKAYKTLIEAAKKTNALIYKSDTKIFAKNGFAFINNEKCPFSLAGDFQSENLKLALYGLCAIGLLSFDKNNKSKIPLETVKYAISKVKWKFRMEKIKFKGQNLLVDGCHNQDGARVLAEYLEKYEKNKKIKFIFGCLQNKE